ncbi:hypothetical protein MSAN_00920400 [Mycena sanguinolenta]|uniref:Uncharacterized protein n=1 Tax=Mycena sanguinolenta TaxID=230812 RepID=A0A8H7D9U7_9AGAR|nr:hypothetical protein MSAN_00920400 [Mycena sanguinolenta]
MPLHGARTSKKRIDALASARTFGSSQTTTATTTTVISRIQHARSRLFRLALDVHGAATVDALEERIVQDSRVCAVTAGVAVLTAACTLEHHAARAAVRLAAHAFRGCQVPRLASRATESRPNAWRHRAAAAEEDSSAEIARYVRTPPYAFAKPRRARLARSPASSKLPATCNAPRSPCPACTQSSVPHQAPPLHGRKTANDARTTCRSGGLPPDARFSLVLARNAGQQTLASERGISGIRFALAARSNTGILHVQSIESGVRTAAPHHAECAGLAEREPVEHHSRARRLQRVEVQHPRRTHCAPQRQVRAFCGGRAVTFLMHELGSGATLGAGLRIAIIALVRSGARYASCGVGSHSRCQACTQGRTQDEDRAPPEARARAP